MGDGRLRLRRDEPGGRRHRLLRRTARRGDGLYQECLGDAVGVAAFR